MISSEVRFGVNSFVKIMNNIYRNKTHRMSNSLMFRNINKRKWQSQMGLGQKILIKFCFLFTEYKNNSHANLKFLNFE